MFEYTTPGKNCYGYTCFSCRFSLGKHRGCRDKDKLKKFIRQWAEWLYEPVK